MRDDVYCGNFYNDAIFAQGEEKSGNQ